MMKNATRWAAIPFLICAFLTIGAPEAEAQKPDFSGIWVLDVGKSDDWVNMIRTGAGNTKSFTKMDLQRIVDCLAHLARTSTEIEIEHSEKEFKTFDKDDNVLIYYIDGIKHSRQAPWGAMLETLADWSEGQLVIVTESKELGKVTKVYAFDGEQLVFVIQMDIKGFESTVIARYIYTRKDVE